MKAVLRKAKDGELFATIQTDTDLVSYSFDDCMHFWANEVWLKESRPIKWDKHPNLEKRLKELYPNVEFINI